ncbi:DUF29 family protein [Sphaerospermopsis sp. LEGE 08334]|jgi:hypothetical protein|uniref:DUF29 family protein n=1 Tax=Sphaerospermopsis sp. LEGE 08334 TaxID=1828651 RepID=UPI0018802438|nr:DUF29 family protein [Sphaerospermopsis sp. LEGE 08334]MBE9059177.1 DUF29 family protein [Sphaerospermopsis sp. LEGE 08334]
MTQELIDLRNSILAGRYEDALAIVDELEGMSKQAILRNIQSFLRVLLIHLIKNQIEQRLTNSWVASIRNSLVEIKKINLKENKKSYYINKDEWDTWLQEEIEAAISDASIEVANGMYTPFQLAEIVDKQQIINEAHNLLQLTYNYPSSELTGIINNAVIQFPGGENWKLGNS